jgi:hypothetical protein
MGSLPRVLVPNTSSRQYIISEHRIRSTPRAKLRCLRVKSATLEDVKPAFDSCTTEKDFLEVLTNALDHPKAPSFLLPAFQDFFNNYKGILVVSSTSCSWVEHTASPTRKANIVPWYVLNVLHCFNAVWGGCRQRKG